MVAEKKECDGAEIEYGYNETIASVEECANKCRKLSSMFAFGTSDFGNSRCITGGVCKCLCETSATKQGSCNQIDHKGYRLYRFRPGMLFPRHQL